MDELNKNLSETYVFAEQALKKLITQLNEAAKNTEAKITELQDLLKIAANPVAATTAPSNSIRELLLNAPEDIGESIYIGEAIPRDDRMEAVTVFSRAFKIQDIVLLATYEDYRIAFTEDALYFWNSDDHYTTGFAKYSEIRKCTVDEDSISIYLNRAADKSENEQQQLSGLSALFSASLSGNRNGDFDISWGDEDFDDCKNYLYNFIMDLKEAAENIA